MRMTGIQDNGTQRYVQAVVIFLFVSAVSAFFLSRAEPFTWEDHFQIGQNLRSAGALTIDDVPSILRPPGFPAFVSTCLWTVDAFGGLRGVQGGRSADFDQRVVVLAHALLLGMMAAAIVVWAVPWGGPILAAALGLTASLNPYALAIANVVSYHLLFIALILFFTLALLSLRCSASVGFPSARVGILLGLTVLVKPVALLLPLFFGPLMLLRRPGLPTAKSLSVIALGMLVVVGPYVVRNYVTFGQPIITAQSGFAFWGTSVEKIPSGEPFLVWQDIWWKYGMPIFSKVTGSAEYSNKLLNVRAIEINHEFTRQAWQNITSSPGVYAHNVLHNFVSFNLDAMGFWNSFLVTHNRSLVALLSRFWIWSLMVLAAAGTVWGAVERDRDCLMVAAIYLGIVVAHAISFATELYTIAKLPLLVLGFVLLVRRLQIVSGNGGLLARSMAWVAAGASILISALALF